MARHAQQGFGDPGTSALGPEAALPGPVAPGLGFQPPVLFQFPISPAHLPGFPTKPSVARAGSLRAQSSAGESSARRPQLFRRGRRKARVAAR